MKHYIPNTQQPQRRTPPPRTSAIFHEQQFEDSRPVIVMVSGILLILFSLVLSGVSFHGGNWSTAFTAPSAARWGMALAVQIYCTAMEWYNRRRKRNPWYISALILDMLSSVGGLLAPVHLLGYVFIGMLFPSFYNALALVGVGPIGPVPPIARLVLAEWAIALLFAYGVARIPEDKLIAG